MELKSILFLFYNKNQKEKNRAEDVLLPSY